MNNLLTYFDIDWRKYLDLFNYCNNVQTIFIIPKSEEKNCLKIGKFNNTNVYEISGVKIKKLSKIGPFITLKNHTLDFQNNDIESAIIKFYQKNRYFKWLAIVNDELEFFSNTFKFSLEKNKIDYTLTFIIPHRNREEQLNKSIIEIDKYIIFNNLDADIWVIEQNDFGAWNKGCTLNIGFLILEKYYDFFIFNDCDTYLEIFKTFVFPRNDEVLHLYGYDYCLGGIFVCSKKTFIKFNGFNNNFFNWGREDRDLEDRCKKNKIKINRDYLIKINQIGAVQLQHNNLENYWNLKLEDSKYSSSRELYYFNQIEHFNQNTNGLSNLKEDLIVDNRKCLISINLIKWSQGYIILKDKGFFLKIDIQPQNDTGILKINYKKEIIEIPINPNEKYPKVLIEIILNKIFFTFNYFLKKVIIIECEINSINLEFENIDLDYYLIYNPFKKEEITYNYTINNKIKMYNIEVNF